MGPTASGENRMRINQSLSRILMNEVDASPGGGAAPAAPAEPTAAPTAPVFDPDALVSRLMGAVEEKLTAHQNATNAALRKAGVFKDKPAGESPTPTQPTTSAPSVQAGLSMADVEAMLERERVITRAATEHKLSDAVVKRMKGMLTAEKPEDVSGWVSSFVADMGLAKAAPAPSSAQPTSQQATPAPAKPNISDRGAAAPTDTRDSDGVLNSRPLEMTPHDVEALVLKHGREKGLQMFQDRVLSALGSIRIQKPRG